MIMLSGRHIGVSMGDRDAQQSQSHLLSRPSVTDRIHDMHPLALLS